MNILFVSIAWPEANERNLYTDLMDEFVLRGHRVYAVGIQERNGHDSQGPAEENGITVLRIYSGQIRKTSYLRKARLLWTLGGKMWKGVMEHFSGERFDLIIGPTPSITLSILFKRLKKQYGAPFYLLLKDIWPQGSVDLKVFRKKSIPWLYLRNHEKRIYRVADHIGCMSPMGAEYILSKNSFLTEEKVEVNPNSIRPSTGITGDPEGITGDPDHTIRDKYGIPRDACVFIFSGNLGIGHGLHFLIEAIRTLSDYRKAYFVIGGSGTHFSYLETRLKALSTGNVFLYNWLPSDDFKKILATSDVGLILLYRYTSPQFPSRLLSYFEYSKPALCAVNRDTDIGSIVEEEECGRWVNHGDLPAFVDAVKYFSEHATERKRMGENGRRLLMERYTVAHSYEIIMNHFK